MLASVRSSLDSWVEIVADNNESDMVSVHVREYDYQPPMHGVSFGDRLYLALSPPFFGNQPFDYTVIERPADGSSEDIPSHPWNWFHFWFYTSKPRLSTTPAERDTGLAREPLVVSGKTLDAWLKSHHLEP